MFRRVACCWEAVSLWSCASTELLMSDSLGVRVVLGEGGSPEGRGGEGWSEWAGDERSLGSSLATTAVTGALLMSSHQSSPRGFLDRWAFGCPLEKISKYEPASRRPSRWLGDRSSFVELEEDLGSSKDADDASRTAESLGRSFTRCSLDVRES